MRLQGSVLETTELSYSASPGDLREAADVIRYCSFITGDVESDSITLCALDSSCNALNGWS